jgi:hypothetical protein
MNRSIFVCILAFFLTVGCSKKPKETVPDSPPPPPTPLPGPSPGTSNGGNAGSVPAGARGIGGSPTPSLTSRGGGAFGAIRRTDAINEMKTLGQEISLLLTELGRMPTKDQILAALKTNSKLLTAISEGSYILTGTTDAGGLWAYEIDADVRPGLALIGGTAAKSTPEELARYFPKK